jgi:hypothetical protein
MNKNWRWVLICYPMLFINAMIAFVYAVVWCRARSWEWREGVLTFVAGVDDKGYGRMLFNPGGQGWSWIVGYASEAHRDDASLRVHENTHVFQEFMFCLGSLAITPVVFAFWGMPWLGLALAGPVGGFAFILSYGTFFLYHFLTRPKGETGWYGAYRRNPFEGHAYGIEDDFVAGDLPEAWGARV